MNISNFLINKIIKDNKVNFISGEKSFFKLIDYFVVGLLLSGVAYYSNKIIGIIMLIHMLGIIFLNRNIINYNKSSIKNINYLYLGLNLLLFVTLLMSLIFNDLVGYSYLAIPLIGYLYILIYGLNIPKYYEQINNYAHHLKEEIWEDISNTTMISKIRLSKVENMYLIGNSHIEIEKNKINLLFDKNDVKINQFIKCLKRNSSISFKVYLGKENIEDYSINSLKNKIFIINNHFQKKYFDYSSVYKNDFEEIDRILDLENVYSKDAFSDTDLLIINVCQSILNNPFYLIFDNVLSRFNNEVINKILKACKTFGITVVILEQKKLDNKYIDNIIDWTEEIEWKKINLKNKKIIRNILTILITTFVSVNLIYKEVNGHNYYVKIDASEISKYTSSKNYTIVYFYKENCSPCSKFKITLNDYIKRNDVKVYGVNINKESNGYFDLTDKYKLEYTPTVIKFKNKKEVKRIEGLVSKRNFLKFMKN